MHICTVLLMNLQCWGPWYCGKVMIFLLKLHGASLLHAWLIIVHMQVQKKILTRPSIMVVLGTLNVKRLSKHQNVCFASFSPPCSLQTSCLMMIHKFSHACLLFAWPFQSYAYKMRFLCLHEYNIWEWFYILEDTYQRSKDFQLPIETLCMISLFHFFLPHHSSALAVFSFFFQIHSTLQFSLYI